jgi:NifB/MoaA-like Fe-S oxidoreductase
MGKLIDIPLIVEPSGIKDVNAIVDGVLVDSPSWRAGIIKGDRLLKVNGEETASRVDAYYMTQKARNPRVEVQRNGESEEIIIDKQANSPSGMVFNYDVHPDTILGIERAILRNRDKSCLLLTSELAYDILTSCIKEKVKIEAVTNRCFGGNIMCAGLLTIGDIEAHMAMRPQQPGVVLLPEIMFDASGRDLLGRHFKELEEGIGIKVEVV